jgi:hypothetical protein
MEAALAGSQRSRRGGVASTGKRVWALFEKTAHTMLDLALSMGHIGLGISKW